MNKPYDDIQHYLNELKSALHGQPAGLVQDAMYDAENHFLDALANDESKNIAELIEAFGSPKEVASQYIKFEKDTQRFVHGLASKPPLFNGFFAPLSSFKSYKSLSYFFISLPLSIAYFGWLALLGVPALVLSIVGVGLPFLALFLKSQTYLVLIEGQLINSLLGVRMPRRPSRITRTGATSTWWQAMSSVLKSPQGWRATLYTMLHFPLSATYFTASCLLFVSSIALILTPIVDPIIHGFSPHLAVDIAWFWFPVTTIVGAIGMTLSMHISRLLVSLQTSIASYLLIQR